MAILRRFYTTHIDAAKSTSEWDAGPAVGWTPAQWQAKGEKIIATYEKKAAKAAKKGKTGPDVDFRELMYKALAEKYNADPRDRILAVTLHRAAGLRAADRGGVSDPYVEVFIEGFEKDEEAKTETVKKTLNPEWAEELRLSVPRTGGEGRALVCHVMDWDRGSSDDFLGEAKIPAATWTAGCDEATFDLTAPTVKRKEGAAITGGLTVSCRWADAGGADAGAAGDEAAALSAEVEELKAKVEQLDADKAQCVAQPHDSTRHGRTLAQSLSGCACAGLWRRSSSRRLERRRKRRRRRRSCWKRSRHSLPRFSSRSRRLPARARRRSS